MVINLILLCSGFGNGFNTATTPLWVSELVPARSRGRHVAVQGNLIAFGIIIAYYFNIGMSYATGPVQWRLVIAFQIAIIILQVLWTWLLPESPRWLAQQGRHAESSHVLAQLMGVNLTSDSRIVKDQKNIIDEAIRLETAEGKWKFKEMFQNGPLKIRRRFILAMCKQYDLCKSLTF